MTHHEEKLRADGQNLISFLNTQYTEKRDFKTEIDTAMRAAFGSNFEELVFTPAADQYIQMRVRWKDLEWPQPTGVLSDGTLRFLYLTAALASPNPPSLIAIDEPETGLHPSMFPIIAELAADAAERTQVVLTTHSPEFLNAFDDTIPTVTVFDWHDGETEMRKVSGDRLKYWLEKYKLGELFRDGDLEAIS
jgi:predicted ATPase